MHGLPDEKYTRLDGEYACASLPLYQLHHCRFNCFILFKYRRHHVCGVADIADAPNIAMYWRQRGCSQYLHVSETVRMFPVSHCIRDGCAGCRTYFQMYLYIFQKYVLWLLWLKNCKSYRQAKYLENEAFLQHAICTVHRLHE